MFKLSYPHMKQYLGGGANTGCKNIREMKENAR